MREEALQRQFEVILGELQFSAIASVSRNAPLIIERLRMAALFDVVVDGTQVSKTKPDPEVFLRAAAMIGIPPADCVVYEDAQAGIEAARHAGMRVVGIGSPDTLKGADGVVPNLSSLLPIRGALEPL